MVNNIVYHFLVLTWGLRYFWKRGNTRKECVEIEDWGTSAYLCWDFKKVLCKACLRFNCFLVIKGILKALFSFISWLLNLSYLPMVQNREKICTKATVKLVLKIIWGIWITSDKQWKVQKFKIQSATFVGKNTFLQLKHYIHRIYLTLLSTTYVKLHQVPLVIFKTISHFSQHNSFALF